MTSLVPYHFYKGPVLIFFEAAAEREGSYPQGRSPRPLLMLAPIGWPALLSTGKIQICIWVTTDTCSLPHSFLTKEPPSPESVT